MQGTFTLTFNIAPAPQPIAITNSTFTATEGTAFTGTIDPITGGSGGPYVVTDQTPLPAGLTIDQNGNITGTPTVSGTGLTANIVVADSQG